MDTVEAKFKEALAEESDYALNDDIYNYIVENADVAVYGPSDAIVDIGSVNPDVYFIVSGVVRGYMMCNGTEINSYFGMEGTMVTSMKSFSMGEPSIIRIEACTPTRVYRIRKARFDAMMHERHDFSLWVAGVFTRRSTFAELKAKVMNGDAQWRYEWLEKCRPELFDSVPLKAIASYLKMTEVHVSRIRKKIAKRQ